MKKNRFVTTEDVAVEINGSNDSEAIQETLTKVKSGNPYRQSGGRFGTGPGKTGDIEEEFDGGDPRKGDDKAAIAAYEDAADTVDLDEAQEEAVLIYTSTAHASINGYLRNDTPSEYAGQVEFIDEAIAKGSFHRDTVVYRGADLGDPAKVQKIIDSGSFIDNGYSSASLSSEVAGDFSKNSQASVLFRIHRQAGDTGLIINKTSAAGNNSQEFEVMLPRGSQFFVAYDGWTTINGNKVRLIGLE